MKTPEEIDRLELLAASYACDYRDSPNKTNGIPDSYLVYSIAYDAFLDGYKAAMDQVADADKVMNSPEKQDSCEHILNMEKMVDVNSSNNSNCWISVKERLPEIPDTRSMSEDVLWLTRYGEMEVSCLELLRSEYRVDWGDAGLLKLDQFTHWMPLPEAPKEEK